MTSLDEFLNPSDKPKPSKAEPASGSFSCQNNECNEIVYDGFIDVDKKRLFWTCTHGHESSVVI